MVSVAPTLRRICVNKTHRSKTLHLPVEMNGYVVEGLVDTGASMSVLAATVVREMGMMHLVTGSENYKIASGVVTRALGRIDEMLVKVGGVQCTMTFMVVDTDSYDVLLGLDLLIKIGAIVDVEQGLIQVRHGPGTNVEVLPLTMVNLLQRVNSEALMQDTTAIWKNTHDNGGSDWISDQGRAIMTKEGGSSTSDSDTNTDDSEHCDLESNQLKQIDCEDEFGDTRMEELVISTIPKHEEVPVLLQLQQTNGDLFPKGFREHLPLSDDCKANARWEEIFQRIRIDRSLDKEKGQQLWKTLERYQDVFAWNKRELGCCTIEEHSIDTQGYPPCRVSPGRLSYWEEAETRRDSFPMPLVEDVISQLGKSAWFTALDLQSGFLQIRMAPEDATDDDDFSEEIRDEGTVQTNATESAGTVFSALYGKTFEWLGFRRHASKQMEHRECCFGINHWRGAEDHQLFMLDVVTGTSHDEENHSHVEDVEGADSEENQNSGPLSDKQALKKERVQYYDRQQQLELALAAQELSESGVFKFSSIESNDEEDHEMGTRCIDIWEDAICLGLLKEGILPDAIDPEESKRARKRASNYC
ncbi:unnamed protein product [Sphagnum troendelagicum]